MYCYIIYQVTSFVFFFFFFQAEDGIRDLTVTGVQTCALPISIGVPPRSAKRRFAGARCATQRRRRTGREPPRRTESHRSPWSRTSRSEIGRASCRERV